MNLKEIEALIKLVKKSGVSEVSVDMKDFKITVKTQGNYYPPPQQFVAAPPQPVASVPVPAL
ncbi:MAG: acetyl-CoA carboxylase, biotin carboxyl carrier protein, partial [Bacteroidia bacterium]|nr:acetyl-CoA carboxylase, biotin carboxyl carrier protein [Bacteroidia bacterium]